MLMLSRWAPGCCYHRGDHPLFAEVAAADAAGSLPAGAEVTVAVHQLQRFIAIIVGLFPVAPEETHGRVRQRECHRGHKRREISQTAHLPLEAEAATHPERGCSPSRALLAGGLGVSAGGGGKRPPRLLSPVPASAWQLLEQPWEAHLASCYRH